MHEQIENSTKYSLICINNVENAKHKISLTALLFLKKKRKNAKMDYLIITKNGSIEPMILNGALNGLISEPDNNVFSIFDTAECQAIFRRIEKLLAA